MRGALTRCQAVYCSAYGMSAEMPSSGTITCISRIAAPLAVYSTAPCAATPAMTTVLIPFCFNNDSSSVPTNLSTPDDTTGSSFVGVSSLAMSAAAPPPPRLYSTGTPAARAAASSLATFGIDAMHRGRRSALHVCLLKSSSSSAVVLRSIVTAFNAGGGGTCTDVHSSTIEAAVAVPPTNAVAAISDATTLRGANRSAMLIDNLQ